MKKIIILCLGLLIVIPLARHLGRDVGHIAWPQTRAVPGVTAASVTPPEHGTNSPAQCVGLQKFAAAALRAVPQATEKNIVEAYLQAVHCERLSGLEFMHLSLKNSTYGDEVNIAQYYWIAYIRQSATELRNVGKACFVGNPSVLEIAQSVGRYILADTARAWKDMSELVPVAIKGAYPCRK